MKTQGNSYQQKGTHKKIVLKREEIGLKLINLLL